MSSALCFVKFGLFKKRRPLRAGCARMSRPDSALLRALLRLALGARTLAGSHTLPDAAFLLPASVIKSSSTRLLHMENSVHCLFSVPSLSRSPRPDRPSSKCPFGCRPSYYLSPRQFQRPLPCSVPSRSGSGETARVNILRRRSGHVAVPREKLSWLPSARGSDGPRPSPVRIPWTMKIRGPTQAS